MDPADEDKVFNLVFAMVTIGGGVMLLALIVLGLDFSKAPLKILTGLYGVFWACYVLWLWDIAFGLPFEASRFTLIPFLLTAATAGLVGIEIFVFWRERNAPPEPGHIRCPKCRRQIAQLMIECPYCHTRIEKP